MARQQNEAQTAWRERAQVQMGQRIFDLREAMGLTQAEFGERFNMSGDSISKWETGDRMVTSSALLKMSEDIGVPLSYFQSGSFTGIEHDLAEAIKEVRRARETGLITGPGARTAGRPRRRTPEPS